MEKLSFFMTRKSNFQLFLIYFVELREKTISKRFKLRITTNKT